MSLPSDYLERVYAGVLGKIIGVYLGRPFEGWSHRKILDELGEIDGYVHERLGAPLVVTDDDISGTFTFLRALPDYGCSPDLSPEEIGQTWLNYLIENRTVLWWGGMGMSTEHTAYLRLKHGIPAPASGSMETNGQVVAEQIGSQIFIDAWGLVNPGDPERAADFARRAASVSHDGEAIYGAQVVAALVAQAFVEADIDRLLDAAVSLIPADSIIARLIADVCAWYAQGLDWKQGFARIEERYGYDKYGGNCHMVPNHALIVHALLHGAGNFAESLKIVNTCGWDTDCNSGNVGCILGVRGGLAGIDADRDWRGPVGDRMFLPTADGGRCVTDAVTEALHVANIGRRLHGLEVLVPKNGARFHFELQGSVQGFHAEDPDTAELGWAGRRLAIRLQGSRARVTTRTFPLPEDRRMPGYTLMASPAIYPGQLLSCRVSADPANLGPLDVVPVLAHYGPDDALQSHHGVARSLLPAGEAMLVLAVPPTPYPVASVGIEVSGSGGKVYLDWLTWDGTPEVTFKRVPGSTWKEQWVSGVSEFGGWGDGFLVIQNEETGLAIAGCREWGDIRVEGAVTPHLAARAGIAARVQGMRRFYALVLKRGAGLQLVKALDGDTVLAECPLDWSLGDTVALALEVSGTQLRGFVNGDLKLEFEDTDHPLSGGGIALVLHEGRMMTGPVTVRGC